MFNFGGFSIQCHLKLLSFFIEFTFKGKNMLPMASIFFPLIVAASMIVETYFNFHK